jgi:hypothetical protein
MKRRFALLGISALSVAALAPAPALAFHCSNASRPIGPGVKAVLDTNGDPISIGKSFQNQIDHGKSPDSLHGGVVGFDCTGDGAPDAITYAQPHGALPEQAINGGSPDHGVVPIETTAPSSCDFGG